MAFSYAGRNRGRGIVRLKNNNNDQPHQQQHQQQQTFHARR